MCSKLSRLIERCANLGIYLFITLCGKGGSVSLPHKTGRAHCIPTFSVFRNAVPTSSIRIQISPSRPVFLHAFGLLQLKEGLLAFDFATQLFIRR